MFKDLFKKYNLDFDSHTIIRRELFLTAFKSARFPKTNANAPSKIDLPAPVSPEIDVKPDLKSTVISSIRAKFFMDNLVINIILFENN